MQTNALRNEMAVINHLNLQPFVTLLLPFEPKMISKHILESRLKSTIEKVKNEIFEQYSFLSAKEVFEKLECIISNLDYNTHKKSVAVLTSLYEQKTIYLDFTVEEKYFISNSFQIRELGRSQKKDEEYLLVILHQDFASVYIGQAKISSKILHKIPDYKRLEQLTLGHSGADHLSNADMLLNNFLQSTDKSLTFLLQTFSHPVIVLGPENIINKFNQITLNNDVIVSYIAYEFDHISEDEVERIIEPYIRNRQLIKERYYKQLLENAIESGKLEVGVEGVWNSAQNKNVKLLVVEDEYGYQAYLGKGLLVCADEASKNPLIKDVVEDAIEKTLADGGHVAIVSKGALDNFMHIAAIKNY